MHDILRKAKRVADHAEVFRITSKRTPVQFEANRLKQIQTKETTSTALRLIKNGRTGFAQASGTIDDDTLIAMALDTCPFGAEAKFAFPNQTDFPQVAVFDTDVEKLPLNEMIEIGQQLIDAVKHHAPDIQCEAIVSEAIATVSIANTSGGNASYTKSVFSLGIEGVLIQDDEMLFVGDSDSSCRPIRDGKHVAADVIRQLDQAKRKAPIATARIPVIFTPQGIASAFISPLMVAFNGKMALDGISPIRDKCGKQLFHNNLTLRDDATIPYGTGSSPCDDEGVATRKIPLIENGVVAQFFYDLQTAALAKTQSTGSGHRGGGLPSPSASSLIIDKGTVAFTDMVKNTKEGLIVEQLMGAEQGNVLNGDFSGNVLLGFKIDNGEITGRVKDTMVAGNIYTILKDIEAIGSDARWIGGMLYTPSLYCPKVSVATKVR
ncbi:MAG TPA: TldD/PmbA family protein [Dehalococcoidia bacterium]|nr:TldD/PmbA family protein [Dehalococcoidia bacterium]